MFSGSLKLDIILAGNENLMYTNIPPRLLFMSNPMGSWKPDIKNCELGKEGSNLVSATERMSTFFDIKSQRLSNLFRIEFMLI